MLRKDLIPEGFMTITQFARLHKVHRGIIYRAVLSAKLPYRKVGVWRLLHKHTPYQQIQKEADDLVRMRVMELYLKRSRRRKHEGN